MKKLFKAIRNRDNEVVRELLDKKPELVFCTAKQPPKKDDGQSPLQVALKTRNFDVAEMLLERGADVNFIEADTCCNEWRAPVIHDAINAAVMNTRWNVNSQIWGFEVHNTEERARRALDILKKIIELGADVNAVDSYGNSTAMRFALQARQILPKYIHSEQRLCDDRILTDELRGDLENILRALIENGMDINMTTETRKETVLESFCDEPIAQIIGEFLV